MEHSNPLIQISHVTKKFGRNRAINDLSLDLNGGKITGLIGNNGSGKTTLFKILAGVLSNWDGSVTINGHKPGIHTKPHVAFLPATGFLNQTLTIPQAIDLYQRFFADFDANKAHDMMEFFQLPFNRTLKEMSKGMGEKVQIALVMARKAHVYLLDEPISGVDPATRATILEGILRNFDDDALLFISTHLVADVEPILDDVVILNNGKLVCYDLIDDLREQYNMSLDQICRKGILL
ncbi:ABC transporter ATP-binding protein [Arcanobacterium phocae]|uniref:ABC transporter ATP-binding protein n=1 Tax=Arcanobacterium phocae TaxID=131112 RepID=UPI001C0F3200|nr:ABC transporter ATP-binding protein [Arcanobacterium phocae]